MTKNVCKFDDFSDDVVAFESVARWRTLKNEGADTVKRSKTCCFPRDPVPGTPVGDSLVTDLQLHAAVPDGPAMLDAPLVGGDTTNILLAPLDGLSNACTEQNPPFSPATTSGHYSTDYATKPHMSFGGLGDELCRGVLTLDFVDEVPAFSRETSRDIVNAHGRNVSVSRSLLRFHNG